MKLVVQKKAIETNNIMQSLPPTTERRKVVGGGHGGLLLHDGEGGVTPRLINLVIVIV